MKEIETKRKYVKISGKNSVGMINKTMLDDATGYVYSSKVIMTFG
jgi:hypothetical protein